VRLASEVSASAPAFFEASVAEPPIVTLSPGADIDVVRDRLKARLPEREILTTAEFRKRSVDYWLFQTGAGAALIAGAALGMIVGVVLGLAFAINIEAIRQWLQHTFGLVLFDEQLYLLAEMPSHITPFEVGAIAGMAMFFSLAASIIPAWRASQLDPVEGLRRE